MAVATNRRSRDKSRMSEASALELYGSISAKYTAVQWGFVPVKFPETGTDAITLKEWRIGWSRKHQAWCASNGSRAWRFWSLEAMQRFRHDLESWDWKVSRVNA